MPWKKEEYKPDRSDSIMMAGGNVISNKVSVAAIARGVQRVSLSLVPVDAIVQGRPIVFDFLFIVLFYLFIYLYIYNIIIFWGGGGGGLPL